MIKRVLKNKLVALGYAATYVESKMKELNVAIDTSQYTESELIQKIEVFFYEKPTAEIPRFFLNSKGDLAVKFLFDGKVNAYTKFSMVGSQISLLDYALGEKLCIIGITEKADIKILLYMPNRETVNRFAGKTYEDIYAEERENAVGDYMSALTDRLSNTKARDIVYVLLSEFIIDTMMIENVYPKLKLQNSAAKFAEMITNYEYKYINRRINRIEYVEKYVDARFTGMGVKLGKISNDPYLLLDEVNNVPDFYLSRPTYVWTLGQVKGQDQLVIYTANETYPQNTYRELVKAHEDVELRQESDRLAMQFSSEMGYQISKDYLFGVLKKLNRELIVLPVDFIRMNTSESYEYIEPLRYRFSVMKNRKEFESVLYNSIEDNLNGRYRYRFVEKLSGIYTTIGNKLNYTDPNGKAIRKQSVADFNINFNAAIIKRETLIDSRSIPQLMGYMYRDLEKNGTDMLPVPSIEVVFYFPEVNAIGQDVEMYNGTAVEIAKGDGTTAFYEIGAMDIQATRATRPKDPNEKYIVVKYVNADGEILKENIIRDVMVGATFVPEMLPIINDREGKEWICEPNQLLSLVVSNDNTKNEIEVKYLRKMARVRINYINKQGSELNPPVMKNMQVGEVFDMQAARKYVDSTKVEWNLYQSKPNKFIVSEVDTENVLTLVYDVVKADVSICYKTRDGRELQPTERTVAVANKEFSPTVVPKIVDQNGLAWQYAPDSKAVIYVEENGENVVTFLYDALKKRVVKRFVDEAGRKIKDDLVEIVQVGQLLEMDYETLYVDLYQKRWKFKEISKPNLKVSEKEEDNICVITYEKLLSNIFISMRNEAEQRIKDDIVEKAQIGSSYKPNAIREIEDASGKFWICVEEDKSLQVEESEIKNRITYHYKPLMTKVSIQYVDVEGNMLLPQREKEVQAGSVFVPDFIASLQGEDQRSWVLSSNNAKDFKVKKHKEENIFKINYDKKLVDIQLSFRDLNGNVLKENVTQKAQLGSELRVGTYEKITADNGERWMVCRTEPTRMFVRENSHFTLIYDEIKAKVIIRCVNISDSKSIVDDVAITTKLGGVYVPNIQQKLVDKLKHRWTYVGEPGMSLIAKENEQENIVLLKYEPDRANVTLRYLNKNQQMVHQDVVSAEQIGMQMAIKQYEKIFEENGMGWKLSSMSRETLTVDEDETKNVVVSNYEPLMVPVTTRYIDEAINEVTTSKVNQVQVGEIFRADILPRVTDEKGRIWAYSNIPVVELKVKDDENNKVNIKYVPLQKKVTEKFVNSENEPLTDEKVEMVQVGEIYFLKQQERVMDAEEKSWIYRKSSTEKIKVLEEEEKNLITNYYEKELVTVTIRYQTTEGVTLDKDKVLELQIGSVYTIEPKETLDDTEKLTWILSKENQLKVKIAREAEKNIFTVVYEKYMVNVYDKYINEATGEEVIKPTVTKHQVGISYLVKVKECIIDEEGRHWVQAARSDIKIFTSNYKVEPITVVRDEAQNVTVVKYKPKLAETIIKYQDPLGRAIKMEEVKKLQVGSFFREEIPMKLMDNLGNKWSYNPNSISDIKISENPKENVVILAYEEFKGTVTLQYYDKAGNELQKPTQKLIQIGNLYVPQFETIITDERGCVWEYAERNIEKFEVKEDEKENIVKLTYVPLNVNVELTFIDLWGNEITPMKKVPAQLGSQFKPTMNTLYTNEKSLVYKMVKMEPESITVKELPIGKEKNPNQFKITFEPVNRDMIICFQDLDGNLLREKEKVHLQVGSKYKPEPIEYIKDKKGNEWHLVSAPTEERVVLENEDENVLKYVYEVAKADIIIRFLNVDGLVIAPEKRLSQQVGSEYVPTPEKNIFDKDNKKWKLLRVTPVNLRVGSINNIVTITYQEDKTRVTWKYCDENGNILKPEERYEVQIGSRYTPIVSNRVIYDASQIWRLIKIEPYEIIISENERENVVNLIYSNSRIEEKKEEKKEWVNPFANTLSPEEAEMMKKEEKEEEKEKEAEEVKEVPKAEVKVEKQEEATGIVINYADAGANNEEPSVKTADFGQGIEQVSSVVSEATNYEEEEIEFKDPDLQGLARTMSLTNVEKKTINQINDMNAKIVEELRKSREAYYSGQETYDYTTVEELILQEKTMIRDNLENLIENDRSGSRLLKIFEHIVASESMDKTFGKLQQRKAVLITDYFLEKPVDDMDKIMYICERGKNRAELEILEAKLKQNLCRNRNEALELKTILYYEKLLLDHYYKARNTSSDDYFIDANVKSTTLPDIVVGVTNLLVKQAVNILRKADWDLSLRNELEGILALCTPQQLSAIKMEVEKFDGKQKRMANKLLQEILKAK